MNAKIISLGLFALLSLVMVVSLASAANVFPSQITGNTFTVNPGATAPAVTFVINNTFTQNLTNIVMTLPDVSSIGSWSSVKEGSNSLTIPSNRQVSLSKVENGTISPVISLTFLAKSTALPGLNTYSTTFSGTYETSGSSTTPDPLPLSITINSTSSLSITSTALSSTQNGSITLTNTGNTPLSLAFSSAGEFNLNLYSGATLVTSPISLLVGEPKSYTVVPLNIPSSLTLGSHSSTITFNDSVKNTQGTQTFTISQSFCKSGQRSNNLSISEAKISSSGLDDTIWRPLDKITVSVEVDNLVSSTVSGVNVELGLFDSTGTNKVSRLVFDSSDEQKVNIGSISTGDHDKALFEFTVPADFKEGSYKLSVKAYSKTALEDNVCTDTSSDFDSRTYQAITVERETENGKQIAFNKFTSSPTEATCGDTVTISFNAVNVGDQNQDQVRVNVKSTSLSINAFQEIKENLNKGDSKALSFTFKVPEGLEDKLYPISLTADYDYKSSSDNYRKSSDKTQTEYLKLFGCKPTNTQNKIVIGAKLVSDKAIAGQPLSIKTTITNNKGSSGIFSISAKGYDSWATLDSVSDRIAQLSNGQSKDVTLEFTIDKSSKGQKSFTLEVLSDSGEVQQKEIVVDVEGKQGFSFSNLSDSFSGNGLIWVIGIINVVLIILIIVVAVKLSNR